MKRNLVSEEQIGGVMKEDEASAEVADLCPKHG
ncbi:hypothetical protein BGCPKDLD_4658 [Methylorubrum suomiense]|uniref:Uncharacterized protein n=1 Tax=Methylorubrum suomiense TaxID=144191 RepID=A0ABQ4V4G5_9HYPH|nr:hypothetical protein BGCPKDLD_4658 [Methylorubrum suomiense]